MRREFADVRDGQVAFTAEDHRTEISAPTQQAREVGCGELVLAQQMFEDRAAFRRRQRARVGAIKFIHEMREDFEVVLLLAMEREAGQRFHHCRGGAGFDGGVEWARKVVPTQRGVGGGHIVVAGESQTFASELGLSWRGFFWVVLVKQFRSFSQARVRRGV